MFYDDPSKLSVWKTRNLGIGLSPFKDHVASVTKEASIIDREMWVLGVNATQAQDIAAAIKIAASYYDVRPAVLLTDTPKISTLKASMKWLTKR